MNSDILKFHDLHYIKMVMPLPSAFCYLILWIWKGFHQNLVMIFSHSSRFLFNFILFSKSNLRLVIKSSLSDLSINVPLNVRHLAFFAHYFLETLQSCQLQTQSVK